MKITHDYKCQKCKKVATINLQNNWSEFSINPKGNFTRMKEWEGDENSFYCDECYEKEMSLTN
jgi:hypothetical protein